MIKPEDLPTIGFEIYSNDEIEKEGYVILKTSEYKLITLAEAEMNFKYKKENKNAKF